MVCVNIAIHIKHTYSKIKAHSYLLLCLHISKAIYMLCHYTKHTLVVQNQWEQNTGESYTNTL